MSIIRVNAASLPRSVPPLRSNCEMACAWSSDSRSCTGAVVVAVAVAVAVVVLSAAVGVGMCSDSTEPGPGARPGVVDEEYADDGESNEGDRLDG
jgi:hypothetical protein